MNNPERNLTQEDVEAILDAFESRFYNNLGKGLWNILWRACVVVLMVIAGWSQVRGGH